MYFTKSFVTGIVDKPKHFTITNVIVFQLNYINKKGLIYEAIKYINCFLLNDVTSGQFRSTRNTI